MVEKTFEGELIENRVIVSGEGSVSLYDENGYGKPIPEENPKRVELDLIEAAYLLEKEKLKIHQIVDEKKKKIDFEDMVRIGAANVNQFQPQFAVFKDLRDRGYLVKTGFKFGAAFRVYERGVRLKRGPKAEHEHTKWVVQPVAEESAFSLPEMSRAVRLAHNIRATFIWAVVDRESDVTYYHIQRITP